MNMDGMWPGSGVLVLPADEAHVFTIHELGATADMPDRPVTTADLVFAATARCKCGAGFCYPNFTRNQRGQWVCSAILLGTAAAGSEHDQAKAFAFWDIKSDQQPSANGATTRPTGEAS